MANTDHLERLRQGVEGWNAWRKEEPSVIPDLRGAELRGANLLAIDLHKADLREADLHGTNLHKADLQEAKLCRASLIRADLGSADLYKADLDKATLWETGFFRATAFEADLRDAQLCRADLAFADFERARLPRADLTRACLVGADLHQAVLDGANLSWADLSGVNLIGANLQGANLSNACLRGAELSWARLDGADLTCAILVSADLTDSDLTGCRIYGISAWGLKLDGAKQQNLIITAEGEPKITADDIEVAQFFYLLLHNKKIRRIIDTITTKVVLILGRFTSERKVVLDALRDELRKHDLLPIIFDFSIPASRDVTETVQVLAGLARFVVADITDATEVRVELHNIIRDFTSLPVQPILLLGEPEFVSLSHLKKFPWLLPSFEYKNEEHLLANLDTSIIGPAEAKVLELRGSQG